SQPSCAPVRRRPTKATVPATRPQRPDWRYASRVAAPAREASESPAPSNSISGLWNALTTTLKTKTAIAAATATRIAGWGSAAAAPPRTAAAPTVAASTATELWDPYAKTITPAAGSPQAAPPSAPTANRPGVPPSLPPPAIPVATSPAAAPATTLAATSTGSAVAALLNAIVGSATFPVIRAWDCHITVANQIRARARSSVAGSHAG